MFMPLLVSGTSIPDCDRRAMNISGAISYSLSHFCRASWRGNLSGIWQMPTSPTKGRQAAAAGFQAANGPLRTSEYGGEQNIQKRGPSRLRRGGMKYKTFGGHTFLECAPHPLPVQPASRVHRALVPHLVHWGLLRKTKSSTPLIQVRRYDTHPRSGIPPR